MKPDIHVLDVESTLDGEWIGMTVAQDALTHIMSVLTDLYSDPEMAVIREYSTNAFDAHIEAGVTRPIEVTTPTQLAPFFRVRDYGTGLDKEDIRNIYSRYGASTKRASDDVVGMLGLGCKSGLTYTDQFTITGIKDGKATHVSITRDMDGGGSMIIVDEYETDDPSGVEVIVPTKQYNHFDQKTTNFFRFWREGTVLVDGVAPTRIDGMWLTDDLLLTRDTDRSLIVMGNVAYPMESTTTNDEYDPDLNRYVHGFSIVAFVGIGDVNFTPSREALQMTKKTKATIEDVKTRVRQEKERAVKKTVNAAQTGYEALELFHTTARKLGVDKVSYKGKEFPEQLKPIDGTSMFQLTRKVGRQLDKPHQIRQHVATAWPRTLWFVDFEATAISPYKRKKLDQWLAKQTLDEKYSSIIVLKEIPDEAEKWVNPAVVFSWQDVEAEKIVRESVPRRDGRPTGSYEGYTFNGHSSTLLAKDIDATKPLFYGNREESGYARTIIREWHPDATVILLSSNRVNKFLRDFPMAQKAVDYIKVKAEEWQKNLTDEDVASLSMNESTRSFLRKLDGEDIADPALLSAIKVAKSTSTKLENQFSSFRSWVTIPDWKNPLNDYPLAANLTDRWYYDRLSANTKAHVVMYINAVYAANQEDN